MKRLVVIVLLTSVLAFNFVAVASAGPALDRVLKRGQLIVGIAGSQPPLNATDKAGRIIGLDADIARLIALNMGVKAEFKTMAFPELMPALKAGKVDLVISSMTMTPDRNLKVAFVGPYYISGKGILTKTQTIAAMQGPDGLNKPEFKIAALEGSTSQEFVEKTTPKATLVKTKSYDAAIDMLLKDKINALIADYPFCAFSAYRYKDQGLTAGQSKLTFEPLGIAIPEDTLLINWMNNFLRLLQGSGQLEKLQDKWFKDGSWIKELP